MNCAHADCTNEGTAHPVLLAMPENKPEYEGPPVEMVLGIRVCKKHQDETVAGDLISEEGWEMILAAFAAVGRAKPDRVTVGLAWRRPEMMPDVFKIQEPT